MSDFEKSRPPPGNPSIPIGSEEAAPPRLPQLELAATSLAIFAMLLIATALFELYFVFLFPETHRTSHAYRHAAGQAGAMIGLGVVLLPLARGAFRDGERSAWRVATVGGGAFVALFAWGEIAGGDPNQGLVSAFAGLWSVATLASAMVVFRA